MTTEYDILKCGNIQISKTVKDLIIAFYTN